MKNQKKIKTYMCATDWDIDIPLGAQDIKIITDLKYFKKTRKCWKECGIVEVELTCIKVIKKGTAKWIDYKKLVKN